MVLIVLKNAFLDAYLEPSQANKTSQNGQSLGPRWEVNMDKSSQLDESFGSWP